MKAAYKIHNINQRWEIIKKYNLKKLMISVKIVQRLKQIILASKVLIFEYFLTL